MIVDFFRQLFQSRVRLVESRARGKVLGVQSRAKSKVSNKFNDVVEAPMNKATNAIDRKKRGLPPAAKGKKKAKEKGKKDGGRSSNQAGGSTRRDKKADSGGKRGFMGLFRSKSKDNGRGASASAAVAESIGDDGATQVIDVSSYQDDRSFDVVGWIVPLNGVDRGRDFRLHTGKNIIGTAADCDIVVTDPYMSAKHAAVIHQNGIFTLIDLGSTNGSCLNDRAVQKEELIDNDTVRVGRTELKFKSLF